MSTFQIDEKFQTKLFSCRKRAPCQLWLRRMFRSMSSSTPLHPDQSFLPRLFDSDLFSDFIRHLVHLSILFNSSFIRWGLHLSPGIFDIDHVAFLGLPDVESSPPLLQRLPRVCKLLWRNLTAQIWCTFFFFDGKRNERKVKASSGVHEFTVKAAPFAQAGARAEETLLKREEETAKARTPHSETQVFRRKGRNIHCLVTRLISNLLFHDLKRFKHQRKHKKTGPGEQNKDRPKDQSRLSHAIRLSGALKRNTR